MTNFLKLSLFFSYFIVQAQVGVNTTTISDGVMLQIESSNSGVLLPRVALVSRSATTPLTGTLTTGTLVFNTAVSGVFPNNVIPGFYFWDVNQWRNINDTKVNRTVKFSNASTSLNTDFNSSSTTGTRIDIFGTQRWNEDTTLYQFINDEQVRILDSGYYEVTVNLSLNSDRIERYIELRLQLNGTSTGDRVYGVAPEDSGNGGDFSIHFTQTIQINANQILSLRSFRRGDDDPINFKDTGTSSITIRKIR
ncbi:hypothetical protein [Cochleicola gelatinilyticus]|uniref:TNF family profile domain-containing protein n=1 Tax=Cochleicola gelatinilyticus TaxID=1763537 RepID=A0A167IHR5_9FLAO|nr:hypothetical protein [Cochleicola gelatinilyticus]OAB79662.1 hypothetical protein ULVI_02625 [Cochleicola gelatinilyticus]